MRWNCPHCGVALSVSEERVTRAWSFSRCYNCSGFSLVRRAEMQLLRVRKTQDGRGLIIPSECEMSEIPKIPSYQLIKDAPSGNHLTPPVIAAPQNVAQQISALNQLQAGKPVILPSSRRSLPQPLPEEPKKDWTAKVFKLGAGTMAALAMASGVYLAYIALTLPKSDKIATQSAAPVR